VRESRQKKEFTDHCREISSLVLDLWWLWGSTGFVFGRTLTGGGHGVGGRWGCSILGIAATLGRRITGIRRLVLVVLVAAGPADTGLNGGPRSCRLPSNRGEFVPGPGGEGDDRHGKGRTRCFLRFEKVVYFPTSGRPGGFV